MGNTSVERVLDDPPDLFTWANVRTSSETSMRAAHTASARGSARPRHAEPEGLAIVGLSTTRGRAE